jgi:hypothetical protein
MAYGGIGTASQGTGTSATPGIPTGVVADDIVLIHGYLENADTITWPAGFVLKFDNNAFATTRGRLVTAWKRATGAEGPGSYTVSWTNSSIFDFVVTRHTGRSKLGDPFADVATANGSTSQLTISASVVNPMSTCDMIVTGSNHATDSGAWTPPSGMTERYDPSGSGVAHLNVNSQDAVAAGSTSKAITCTGIAGTSFPKLNSMSLYADDQVRFIASTNTVPTGVSSEAVTMPTHAAGDRIRLVIGMKPDTSSVPTVAGWSYVGDAAGGSPTPTGLDVGPMRLAVFEKDATSSSETATVVAGPTPPNSWLFHAVSFRHGTGLYWADPPGTTDQFQGGQDTAAGASSIVTVNPFSKPPVPGDAIHGAYTHASDSAAGTWNFNMSATGIATNAPVSASKFSTTLGNDMTIGYNDNWNGIDGTPTAGVALNVNHASSGGESGYSVMAAIMLRQSTTPPIQAGWGFRLN